MPKKSKIPPQEEQPDERPGDDLTANVIHEEDFDTQVPQDVEYLPDSETEVLPATVDKELLEDWQKIEESESGYLPENLPQEPSDIVTVDVEAQNTADEAILADEPQEDSAVADEPEEISVPTPRKPVYSEPPKPAWKIHAEQMAAEREAAKQKMIDDRRRYEEAQRGSKEQYESKLREGKQESDAEVKAKIEALRKEKEAALEDMVERIREENERKRLEREAADEQLRKEREARSYKANRDVDNRTSRLSKKED